MFFLALSQFGMCLLDLLLEVFNFIEAILKLLWMGMLAPVGFKFLPHRFGLQTLVNPFETLRDLFEPKINKELPGGSLAKPQLL